MDAGSHDGGDAELAVADVDGVFPEGFYATTNHATDVRVRGAWVRVEGIEMDVGVRVTGDVAEAWPMHRVRKGDVAIVVATTLHGVATGNMLPASVATFCVDSSADTVIKLVDRGTHQAVGSSPTASTS